MCGRCCFAGRTLDTVVALPPDFRIIDAIA
jgi:hypothetical protein